MELCALPSISILHLFKFHLSSKILPETFPDVSSFDPPLGACGLYLYDSLSAVQPTALASSPARHPFFLILDHLIEGKNLT